MSENKGFTLVEVALVILIAGLMIGAFATSLTTYLRMTRYNAVKEKIQTIDNALKLFLELNGRYPCVAKMDDAPDTATFGVEIGAVSGCNTAGFLGAGETIRTAGFAKGYNVRIGALPVRTLNLPDDYMMDSWGARFTYAVVENLATDSTYNATDGDIRVIDSNNNPLNSEAHYVVVSHGENSSGAVSFAGANAAATVCPAGNIEEENCNADSTFRSTILTSSASTANEYDDLISIGGQSSFGTYIPAGAVVAFNAATCPVGWTSFASAQKRVIVGADPTGGDPDYVWGYTNDPDSMNIENDEVALELSQIPVVESTTNLIDPTLVPGLVPLLEIPVSGEGAPHNNMPPYLALVYCQKT